MTVLVKKTMYIGLAILVIAYLGYLDVMLGLSLQYDVNDVMRVSGVERAPVFNRLLQLRVVLTLVVLSLMVVQFFLFQSNQVIPLVIAVLSTFFLFLYYAATLDIRQIIDTQDSIVSVRAASQLKHSIDSNIISYYCCLGAFLLCSYFLQRKTRNPRVPQE